MKTYVYLLFAVAIAVVIWKRNEIMEKLFPKVLPTPTPENEKKSIPNKGDKHHDIIICIFVPKLILIVMRYINNICFETKSLLNRIYKYSSKHETRQRAKCIVLSNKGFDINELVDIFDVHLNTIYNWLGNWEEYGLISLYNSKGRGRKPKITSDIELYTRDLVKENPKQLKKVVAKLETEKGVKVSTRTIKRLIKKNTNTYGNEFLNH